jgi:hypothetical protein
MMAVEPGRMDMQRVSFIAAWAGGLPSTFMTHQYGRKPSTIDKNQGLIALIEMSFNGFNQGLR